MADLTPEQQWQLFNKAAMLVPGVGTLLGIGKTFETLVNLIQPGKDFENMNRREYINWLKTSPSGIRTYDNLFYIKGRQPKIWINDTPSFWGKNKFTPAIPGRWEEEKDIYLYTVGNNLPTAQKGFQKGAISTIIKVADGRYLEKIPINELLALKKKVDGIFYKYLPKGKTPISPNNNLSNYDNFIDNEMQIFFRKATLFNDITIKELEEFNSWLKSIKKEIVVMDIFGNSQNVNMVSVNPPTSATPAFTVWPKIIDDIIKDPTRFGYTYTKPSTLALNSVADTTKNAVMATMDAQDGITDTTAAAATPTTPTTTSNKKWWIIAAVVAAVIVVGIAITTTTKTK